MRKLLVKHFVGYWRVQNTWTRAIAEHILLPLTIAIVFLAFDMIFVVSLIALTGILWILPLKKKEIKYPRPSRKVFYYILVSAILSHLSDNNTILMIILGVGFLLLVWVAFNGYKVGYFDLWPIKIEELDADQLIDSEDLDKYNDKFKPK